MPTFVLVHGSWHGAWCWRRVLPLLREGGAEAHAVTLTGLGDRAHLLTADVSLDTHVEDVVRAIEAEELQGVTLVGHSYGGAVISGVADRIGARLSRLIYLDALLLEDGESLETRWAPPEERDRRARAVEAAGGDALPPPPPQAFGVTDEADLAWLARRLTPQPAACARQPLQLTRPLGAGLPKAYIDCTRSELAVLEPMKKALGAPASGWDYATIDTGHDAMITRPRELAALLLDLAVRPPAP